MYNNRIITMTSNIVIVSTSSITMQQFEEQNNMGQLMHTDDIKIEIEHVPIEASPDTIEQMSLEETSNIVIVSTSSITMQQFEELDTLPWLLEPRDIELPMQTPVLYFSMSLVGNQLAYDVINGKLMAVSEKMAL